MELKPNFQSADIRNVVEKFRPDLAPFEGVYRDLHQNPELSLQESCTASIAANFMEDLKFGEIVTNIGGHGGVGILRNGAGPKVMLRADMDALPREEPTGPPYASKKAKDRDQTSDRRTGDVCQRAIGNGKYLPL